MEIVDRMKEEGIFDSLKVVYPWRHWVVGLGILCLGISYIFQSVIGVEYTLIIGRTADFTLLLATLIFQAGKKKKPN